MNAKSPGRSLDATLHALADPTRRAILRRLAKSESRVTDLAAPFQMSLNSLELDRPRKIVFTWIVSESEEADPSKVTLSIQPEAEGCLVTLIHEMDAKWAEYVSRTEGGWSRMLEHVDLLLAEPR